MPLRTSIMIGTQDRPAAREWRDTGLPKVIVMLYDGITVGCSVIEFDAALIKTCDRGRRGKSTKREDARMAAQLDGNAGGCAHM